MPKQRVTRQFDAVEDFVGYQFMIPSDEYGRRDVPVTFSEYGKLVMHNLHLAVDADNALYMYKDGVYVDAKAEMYLILAAMYERAGDDFNTTKDNQILDYITKQNARNRMEEKPAANMVNLRNGIWFIEQERFEPHEEQYEHWKYRTYVQLPITYDPACVAKESVRFLKEAFPGGEELLIDILGSLLTSNTAIHKAVVLLGNGNNGKSLFFYLAKSLLGPANYSSTAIQSLADPSQRFVNYDIVGKLANIGDDTPQTAIADTANIKMIISGGNIKVEGKFKKAHNYIPFCKLVFACNSRIQSSDPSKGYKRRFFNVPFKVQFQTDPTIEQAFQSEFDKEEEKSGLFNEITKRFKATYKTGYIIPHAVAHDVEMYEPYPEGLEEWLANNLVKSPGHQIPAADLTSAINFVLDRRGNKGPKKCYTMKRVCRWVLNKFGISEDAGGDVVKDSTIQQHRPTTEGVKKTYLTGLSVVDPSIFDTSSGPDDVKFSEDVNDDAEGLDYDD